MLALDVSGNPDRWISHELVAYYESKNLVAWKHGLDNFTLHGGINARSGIQSTLDISTIVAIKGRTMRGDDFSTRPSLTNKALFRRDHNICAYCGNDFNCAMLTRDHVHPTSRGGANVWENVVTACTRCNKHKDNKLLSEINMELLYVPYAPSRSEYLILSNRKILADQMEFLMINVPQHSNLHVLNFSDKVHQKKLQLR